MKITTLVSEEIDIDSNMLEEPNIYVLNNCVHKSSQV